MRCLTTLLACLCAGACMALVLSAAPSACYAAEGEQGATPPKKLSDLIRGTRPKPPSPEPPKSTPPTKAPEPAKGTEATTPPPPKAPEPPLTPPAPKAPSPKPATPPAAPPPKAPPARPPETPQPPTEGVRPPVESGYGYAASNPILLGPPSDAGEHGSTFLAGVQAERTYLRRLRDARLRPFRSRRQGTALAKDGHPVDRYDLTDEDGKVYVIYVDMYHPEVDAAKLKAPRGMRLAPSPSAAPGT